MVDIVSKNQSLVKSLDKLEMVWIEVLPLKKQTLGVPLAPNVFKFDFIQNILVITFLNVSLFISVPSFSYGVDGFGTGSQEEPKKTGR